MGTKSKAGYQFENVVYVTLKHYNELRRQQVVKNIYVHAAVSCLNVEPFEDGFVMSYSLAKAFVRNLHLHCSRFFSRKECMKLRDKRLITAEEYEAVTA